MANIKKLPIKHPLLLLSSLVLVLSFFSVLIMPANSFAAPKLSYKECQERYGGKKESTGGILGDGNRFAVDGCKEYCQLKNDKYSCSSEQGLKKAAAAVEAEPLISLLCSSNDGSQSGSVDAAYDSSTQRACSTKVKQAYESCKSRGGNVADCVRRTTRSIAGVNNASGSQINEAIAKGKERAKEYTAQEQCKEQGGKVWQDGECVVEEDAVSCAIDGIGWVVCPAMRFLAMMNDRAFEFIAGNFLELDATNLRDNADLKNAWESFRTIANGVFVIAFLAIIYGQMTGRGN